MHKIDVNHKNYKIIKKVFFLNFERLDCVIKSDLKVVGCSTECNQEIKKKKISRAILFINQNFSEQMNFSPQHQLDHLNNPYQPDSSF